MFRGERLDYPDGSGNAILDFSVTDRNLLPDFPIARLIA
jgi:hypothetical protein